jgi:16S rRNA (uracil1498-N3)-methyltransferase
MRSLRLRPGEEVTLADGRGTVGWGSLQGEDTGLAVIRVEGVSRVVRRPPVVSVALAPPKGDRLSWAVQKLGELGVDETVLIASERSVRTWDAERSERAATRLEVLAREAAMQSRQPFVMDVRAGLSFDDALSEPGTPVVLFEGASTPLASSLPEGAGAIRLVVGPEGGFTDREVGRAEELGARVASLGDAILRTETAALAGAILTLARYGRLG